MNRHDFYNILKAHAEKENGRYTFKVIDLKVACAEIEDAISNSHKHDVMQAEASDGVEGAAVASEGQEEANTSAGFCNHTPMIKNGLRMCMYCLNYY